MKTGSFALRWTEYEQECRRSGAYLQRRFENRSFSSVHSAMISKPDCTVRFSDIENVERVRRAVYIRPIRSAVRYTRSNKTDQFGEA